MDTVLVILGWVMLAVTALLAVVLGVHFGRQARRDLFERKTARLEAEVARPLEDLIKDAWCAAGICDCGFHWDADDYVAPLPVERRMNTAPTCRGRHRWVSGPGGGNEEVVCERCGVGWTPSASPPPQRVDTANTRDLIDLEVVVLDDADSKVLVHTVMPFERDDQGNLRLRRALTINHPGSGHLTIRVNTPTGLPLAKVPVRQIVEPTDTLGLMLDAELVNLLVGVLR